MRHRVATKTLNRDAAHRKSLLRNLSTSLVLHEKVVTTTTKAKYLRPYIEKLITKAKKGNDFNTVKYLKARLTQNDAVRKIISDIGPRFISTPGGYTRIVKMGERKGDNASMARIEFTKGKVKPTKKEPSKGSPSAKASGDKTVEKKKVRGRPKKS